MLNKITYAPIRSKRRSAMMVCVIAVSLALIYGSLVTANFSSKIVSYAVFIDNVNYGSFDHVDGLTAPTLETPYWTLVLKRDFVTEPSLYLWAKNASRFPASHTDEIMIRSEGEGGATFEAHKFRLYQPLAWTVESADPTVGGFHEKVAVVVGHPQTL